MLFSFSYSAQIRLENAYLGQALDMTVFWTFGQCMLCLMAMLYRKLKTYDVHRVIEFDDNAAAGLGFGSILLSMGIIVRAGVIGAGSESLIREWALSVTISIFGLIILLATHLVIARWVASGADLQDEIEMKRNTALAMVMAGSILAIATLLSTLIQR
jgi:uncharacterized membrane protein YjfL (UPF0719 family)